MTCLLAPRSQLLSQCVVVAMHSLITQLMCSLTLCPLPQLHDLFQWNGYSYGRRPSLACTSIATVGGEVRLWAHCRRTQVEFQRLGSQAPASCDVVSKLLSTALYSTDSHINSLVLVLIIIYIKDLSLG